ncbi:MAG: hypothetical protein EOP83_28775, partial [Verrucomicrobiaceae bacterium]
MSTAPVGGDSVAGWQMPIEIRPIQQNSGETIIESVVPGTGVVRANVETMKTIGQPLVSAPGRNRTIKACAEAVQGEARKA